MFSKVLSMKNNMISTSHNSMAVWQRGEPCWGVAVLPDGCFADETPQPVLSIAAEIDGVKRQACGRLCGAIFSALQQNCSN